MSSESAPAATTNSAVSSAAAPPTPAAPPIVTISGYDAIQATAGSLVVSAARGYRLINGLVDGLLSGYYGLVAAVITVFGYRQFGSQLAAPDWTAYACGLGAFILTWLGYYVIQERLWGRTFGKALTATQVVTALGDDASVWRIIGRTLTRLIPLEALTIFGPTKRGLHDRWSGTLVVSARSLPEPRQRRGWFLRVVAVLAILPVGGLYFANPVYAQLVGAEQIELPVQLPADLKLSRIDVKTGSGRDYYVMTFTGADRTIVMSRMAAGSHYDASQNCSYMAPTRNGQTTLALDSGLSCPVVAQGRAAKVREVARSKTARVGDSVVPDFILDQSSYRYALRATTGELTTREAVAMANGFKAYELTDLRRLAQTRGATPQSMPRVTPLVDASPTASPTPTATPTPAVTPTPAPTPTPVPAPAYLEINELGLRIPLADSIKDLTYSYAPANFVDAHGRIQLSTASISGFAGGACSTSKEPLGAYVVFKKKQAIPDDQLVKAANGYYIYYGRAQSNCGGNDAERNAVAALIDPVLAAMRQSEFRP